MKKRPSSVCAADLSRAKKQTWGDLAGCHRELVREDITKRAKTDLLQDFDCDVYTFFMKIKYEFVKYEFAQ